MPLPKSVATKESELPPSRLETSVVSDPYNFSFASHILTSSIPLLTLL